MLLPILLLSAAGFTVLTTEFVIIGLLPAMARDLGVEVAQAGLLVSLFAFTVAATGPFSTALMAALPRKRVFVAALAIFGVANVMAAWAPNIYVMGVARFVPALALPVFWSLSSDTAISLVGPAKAGRAVSMVAFGIVVATVLGIPIGVLIADAFGWRAAFMVLAVLAFAKAGLLQRYMPAVAGSTHAGSLAKQLRSLRDPVLVGHVLLSLLVFTGMFTAYTYLADMLERLAGFNGQVVGWSMMAFGAVGLIGNTLGGRMVDRSPIGATALFSVLMAAALAAVASVMHAPLWLAPVLALWGIAQSALFIVCHARVMKAAPHAAAFAASLNISGANIGIGVGAALGGRVIATYGLGALGWAAAAVLALALLVAAWLTRATRRAMSAHAASATTAATAKHAAPAEEACATAGG
ncbi:MFS transporter [Bordetella genomosp. 10]|uniref:MFS transporter n=1 Tax=Bordetella genomosp. 10 TaxID=1416804 RepID=A0A261SKK7_9BORD|nr:MFS transporter [Bordetella genomosp. 10]OZI36873.1 MFS transporter [Bordetella genomosp. 10]